MEGSVASLNCPWQQDLIYYKQTGVARDCGKIDEIDTVDIETFQDDYDGRINVMDTASYPNLLYSRVSKLCYFLYKRKPRVRYGDDFFVAQG